MSDPDLAINITDETARISELEAENARLEKAWEAKQRYASAVEQESKLWFDEAQKRGERVRVLEEALEGFVRDLIGSLDSRETMLTINHAALCRRIEQARAVLAKLETPDA